MGIFRIAKRLVYTTALTGAGAVGYLGFTTHVVSPLPQDDPIFRNPIFAKYNIHKNASTQDVVFKRVPLDKIKPELLEKPGALTLELCRGVWSGLGYRPQRYILERNNFGPATSTQLWKPDELASSTYDVGTQITDHFEVVHKTADEIVVRCGDSPRNAAPRDSDGLFIISAQVDPERREAILALKSALFVSGRKVEGIQGPMPGYMEELHRWYARLWLATGSRRVLR